MRVNQDELGSKEKCMLKAEEFVKAGKSVVIDNTNCNKFVREFWITAAKNWNVSIRAVMIEVDLALCKHLNQFRLLNTAPTLLEPKRKSLALDWRLVLSPQFKEYAQSDLLKEGFTGGVRSIEFSPTPFADARADQLFRQYLVAG